mmetsp:Transcript_58955/g.117128  ORF Transcript_58955/g.117128 Transcript_58955/m.117128 type:complete len:240 (-) Transcript_58955:2497-3216(-)
MCAWREDQATGPRSVDVQPCAVRFCQRGDLAERIERACLRRTRHGNNRDHLAACRCELLQLGLQRGHAHLEPHSRYLHEAERAEAENIERLRERVMAERRHEHDPVNTGLHDALLVAIVVRSVAGNPQRLDVRHRATRARVAEARAPVHGMLTVEAVVEAVECTMHHSHRLALDKSRCLSSLELDVVAVEEVDQAAHNGCPRRERARSQTTVRRKRAPHRRNHRPGGRDTGQCTLCREA